MKTLSPACNDITGDPIVTGSPNQAYMDGWSRVFGETRLERKAREEREAKERKEPEEPSTSEA